jgi:threo-3-hydroxy-L-aspartate ammonia-lyase
MSAESAQLDAAISQVDVEAAARRLVGVAHRTPIATSRTLDERVGASVFLKAENLQRAGAFKFRGAYNRVSTLAPADLERGVVASSSGNHAQALALAARLCGTRATILMPEDAPASKRAATLGYGAEVISFDRYRDDRELLTAQLAKERGAAIVHPYDDPLIVSGAGTSGLELIEDAGPLDAIVVCTGGGGLLAGCSAAVKLRSPEIQIFAVEPEASNDWQLSFRSGGRVKVEVGATIADGQQLATPGALNFAIAAPLLKDVVTVTDDEVLATMRFLFERLKLVVEPSGATALAALMSGKLRLPGQRVGVTISGGNIDTGRFARLLGQPQTSRD